MPSFVGCVFRLAMPLVLASVPLVSAGMPDNFDLGNMAMFVNVTCPLLLVSKQYSEMQCQMGELRNASYMNCPRDFNCKALASRPKTQCQLKGRTYKIGAKLPSARVTAPCKHSCVCRLDSDGYAGFECQTRKCAPVKPECRQTYADTMQCCPKNVCGTPKPSELICNYMDKSFIAGEVMDHTFNVSRCICRKGFKGVLKPPFCQPVDCGIELSYDLTMRKGCSPVYQIDMSHFEMGKDILNSIFDFLRLRLGGLCPVEWACPSDDDVVVPLTSMAPEIPVIDKFLTCRYGNNDMAMLDLAMSPELPDGSCTMCVCIMPPNLFCMHKAICWAF